MKLIHKDYCNIDPNNMVASTTGRRKKRTSTASVAPKVGWKSDTADGVYLEKILRSGKVAPGITPKAFQEQFPRYRKYERRSFGAALRRFKQKSGLMIRNPKRAAEENSIVGNVNGVEDDISAFINDTKTKKTAPEDNDDDGSSFAPKDDRVEDEELSDDETMKPPTVITAPGAAAAASNVTGSQVAGTSRVRDNERTTPRAFKRGTISLPYQLNFDQWKPPVFKMRVEDFQGNMYSIVTVLLPSSVGNDDTSKGLWLSLEHGILVISMKFPTWLASGDFLEVMWNANEGRREEAYKDLVKEMGDAAPNKDKFMREQNHFHMNQLKEWSNTMKSMKTSFENNKHVFLETRVVMNDPEDKVLTNKHWQLVGHKASGTNIIHIVLKEKPEDILETLLKSTPKETKKAMMKF